MKQRRKRTKSPALRKSTLESSSSTHPNPKEPLLASWSSAFLKLHDYKTAIEEKEAYYSEDSFATREQGSLILKPAHEQMLIAAVLWPILPDKTYAFSRSNIINVIIPMILSTLVAVACQGWIILKLREMNMERETEFTQIGTRNLELSTADWEHWVKFQTDNPNLNQKEYLCSSEVFGDFYLRLACVGTFIAWTCGELHDTLIFAMWISRLPSWEDTDQYYCKKMQCGLVMCRKILKDARGCELRVNHIAAGGVSWWYRIIFMYGACSVKFVIEILILWQGTGYIFYANDNESLIGNAMALTFVLEIDDVVFKFLVTDMYKRNMENEVPGISLRSGSSISKELYGRQHFLPKPADLAFPYWGEDYTPFDAIFVAGSQYMWGRITVFSLVLVLSWYNWCGWQSPICPCYLVITCILALCFFLPCVLLRSGEVVL
jgi:hypothetical protein